MVSTFGGIAAYVSSASTMSEPVPVTEKLLQAMKRVKRKVLLQAVNIRSP